MSKSEVNLHQTVREILSQKPSPKKGQSKRSSKGKKDVVETKEPQLNLFEVFLEEMPETEEIAPKEQKRFYSFNPLFVPTVDHLRKGYNGISQVTADGCVLRAHSKDNYHCVKVGHLKSHIPEISEEDIFIPVFRCDNMVPSHICSISLNGNNRILMRGCPFQMAESEAEVFFATHGIQCKFIFEPLENNES